LLGGFGEEAEHCKANQEPIRRRPGVQAEHGPESVTLWSRNALEPIEQRCAELMQAGVGQLHLRLRPYRPHDLEVRRRVDQVLQQRRLADPGLATQNQRPTLAAADVSDQAVQQGALSGPPEQARRPDRSAKTVVHRQPVIVKDPVPRNRDGTGLSEPRALHHDHGISKHPRERDQGGHQGHTGATGRRDAQAR
jgi:hypothetical protein